MRYVLLDVALLMSDYTAKNIFLETTTAFDANIK